MKRFAAFGLAAALLAPALAAAADGPAGNWKMSFPVGRGQTLSLLIKFSEQGGKWSGNYLGSNLAGNQTPTIEDVKVADDRLRFTLRFAGESFTYDGKVPAEKGKKVAGSFDFSGNLLLVHLEPTKVEQFDPFELNKETLAKGDASSADYFDAALDLLHEAGPKKVPAAEVRGWADKAAKAAEAFGPRWQLTVSVRAAQALAAQEGYADVALAQARRAERILDPNDEASVQLRVLEVLARVLQKAGKAADAKEVQARVAKLEERDFEEYAKKMAVKAPAFAGRKGASDRAALVELFTGTECPPCVAADLAFEAAERAFKPTEVVLLQYHLHVPGPDPLANAATDARGKYYDKQVEGTPTVLVDGKPAEVNGGGAADARDRYRQFAAVLEKELEKPAGAKLEAKAAREGDKLKVSAKVSGLAKPGPSLRLRFAVVEERVRYRGGNGVRYHHCVVRGFAGGPDGFPLTKADAEQSAEVDVEKLRADLNTYLDTFAKENEGAQFPERPMRLDRLRVVAFVQDDATHEVVQAVQAGVGK
jgi:uncharacterized glyoxalase superfamily protein PhnB